MNNQSKKLINGFCDWLSRNITMLARPNGKFILRMEKRLQKDLRRVFKFQRDWLVIKIRQLSIFEENAVVDKNGISDEIKKIMNDFPGKVVLANAVIAKMKQSTLKGGKESVKKLKLSAFGISFDLTNQTAIRFLGGRLSHELSQSKGTIHDTTVQGISRILKQGAEEGASYEEIALRIREQYDDAGVFSQARAELIATREIGIAYEKGNWIPVQEFRIKHPTRPVLKYWQTVGDDRVTKPHKANQADGWIPFEQDFSGTGDQTAPGSDNPRCRCATKYEIKKPKK